MPATIYARVFRSWFGARAPRLARERLEKLRRRGDTIGAEIWTKIIAELERPARRPAPRFPVNRRSSSRNGRAKRETLTSVLREEGPGTRVDSTDRGAMLEVFGRYFPGLSRRELGKLFDKYRKKGWIDILWDDRAGRYVVTLMSRAGSTKEADVPPHWKEQSPDERLTSKVWH